MPRRRLRAPRPFLAALAASVAVLAAAQPAAAARDADVSIMDDQLLLGATADQIDGHMSRIQALGVDRLRVSAFWAHHAPSASSTVKPAGFDGSNPADPRYIWNDLDRVAVSARKHGIPLLISVTMPAPFWGTADPSQRNWVLYPVAAEFAAYARAVASRYRGFADQYAISNEPNQPGWLQPQTDGKGAAAPHHYRDMVLAAYPALKQADPSAKVLVGELSSSGSSKRGPRKTTRPLSFLRSMGCVSRRYGNVRSGRCAGFQGITADAIGHHPYSLFTAPNTRSRNRDDAAIGDRRRLLSALDRLTKKRAVVPSEGKRLDVHFTEFGYQTDPPDPFAGVTLKRQDRWLQDAAFLTWRTKRIKQFTQFRLTDGAINKAQGLAGFKEFQSGLLFRDFRPKPAFRSFQDPFAASTTRPRRGSRVLFWGQVRPGGRHTVSLEFRRGNDDFKRLASVETDARGYFSRRLEARSGTYRYTYADDAASGGSSRIGVRVR